MGDRGVGKPWTPYEDSLLTQAVAIHGEVDNWKTVALSVPGRTNKACRKRWLHSLSPSIKKTAWTTEEDQLLLSLYAIHSTKWSVIARHIPGRTDDACSKRYREALDPSLKRDEWTSQEDALLLEVYARLGGKWGQVGQELQRSGLACRNRWRMIERKKAALVREDASRNAAPQTSQPFPETYPSHVTSQWSSVPVQHGAFWDGNVPPYVVPPPSMDQFRSNPSFVVTQPATSAGSPPFQFASSSLSAAFTGSEPLHDTTPHTPYPHDFSQEDRDDFPDRPSLDVEQPSANTFEEQDIAAMDVMLDFDFHADTSPVEDSSPSHSPVAAVNSAEELESRASVHSPTSRSAEPVSSPASPADENGPTQIVADSPAVASTAPDPLRHYRPAGRKTVKSASARKGSDRSTRPPPRLSSNLPAAGDSAILAYACGHQHCWPSDAASSRSCFTTSKDLLEHTRAEHPDGVGPSGPFRCALQGCGKSWKSINGLQYHLQISKVHFQEALSASRNTDDASGDTQGPAEDGTKNKKVHLCPRPNCPKQYKQLSGLRYHMTHGHPTELPAQLEAIPPVLARKVAERTPTKAT